MLWHASLREYQLQGLECEKRACAFSCNYIIVLIVLVFGKQGIPFKKTFEAAQEALRSAFGMEMEMLSTKENVSVKARLSAY